MKTLRYLAIFISLLFSCANSYKEHDHSKNDISLLTDQFISKIAKLDFIQAKEIEQKKSDTSFKHFVFLSKHLLIDDEYLVVQAGHSTTQRYKVYFNFYCSIRDKKIFLYDALQDDLKYLGSIKNEKDSELEIHQ
jgi:predicted DNA-binding ArsR family transcriptional regulator